ncbi:histone-like nucleoid-structuring protein Lsr2 [Nocardia noduli]|uniref:histone-like nucleoid-structuring protein Lsr2 n=1 Tax=Nocardia noduli TaxID=2815722 RepID=UPI001C21C91B|nr:Lsr2 family protein [Nocardia noduli]
MARKVTIAVVDDFDSESTATQDVSFGVDGVTYEIDLCDKNAVALRAVFEPYVTAGRRVGGRSRRNTRPVPLPSRPNTNEIREWAKANGHPVPARGRVPGTIVTAYNDAHS